MFAVQKPEPIQRGKRATDIAEQIKVRNDTDLAMAQFFGREGQRKHLPKSLRKAVRARLEAGK